jgi:hypothetical protein
MYVKGQLRRVLPVPDFKLFNHLVGSRDDIGRDERIAEDVDRLGTLRVRCLEGSLELIRLARLDDDQCEPGHITTRMRQALDETECDRVAYTEENERNRPSTGVDRDRGWRCAGDDNL